MTVSSEPMHTSLITDPAALLELYAISQDDLGRIRAVGETLEPHLIDMVDRFCLWLAGQPEFDVFFSDTEVLDRVKRLQIEYWRAFFAANVDENYLESRRVIGQTHSRIGLALTTYFAGTTKFFGIMGEMLRELGTSEEQRIAEEQSVVRLLHLDIGIVVEAYTQIEKAMIASQNQALMEMSTPVTEIWTGILLLPLVGIIDSKRAQDIMNATLSKILDTHARIVILDISGVAVVDTAVANHLVKITKATRLMGCESTISGVSPAIAQTIVELGIEIGGVNTTATMSDALGDALRSLRLEIREVTGGHGR